MRFTLRVRLTAEFFGTAFLLMAVVGSGIMGEQLAAGNVAIVLLANTLATGAALVAIILTLGPISGAHLNSAVTLGDASQAGISWREVPGYVVCQIVEAFVGVACAHLMFGLRLFSASRHTRAGTSQVFTEFSDIRITVGHMGLCARTFERSAFRCGGLYNGSVLVYSLDFLCKSRGNNREIAQ